LQIKNKFSIKRLPRCHPHFQGRLCAFLKQSLAPRYQLPGHKMRQKKGFSLIELMIVVAIIGILAVMAVPSYQSYTRKARFAEVVMIAEAYKIAVALALQQGASPEELANGTHGIPTMPPATRNLASLVVDNGIITATASNLAANATYILKPNTDGSIWSISGTCVKLGFCNG